MAGDWLSCSEMHMILASTQGLNNMYLTDLYVKIVMVPSD